MSDEPSSDGREGLDALDDEERTAVIVPRLGRPEFSLGLRRLGDALSGFSSELHGGSRFIDEGTALGYAQVTPAEAEDVDEILEALEHRVRGVRAVLKRAINPGPSTSP